MQGHFVLGGGQLFLGRRDLPMGEDAFILEEGHLCFKGTGSSVGCGDVTMHIKC